MFLRIRAESFWCVGCADIKAETRKQNTLSVPEPTRISTRGKVGSLLASSTEFMGPLPSLLRILPSKGAEHNEPHSQTIVSMIVFAQFLLGNCF